MQWKIDPGTWVQYVCVLAVVVAFVMLGGVHPGESRDACANRVAWATGSCTADLEQKRAPDLAAGAHRVAESRGDSRTSAPNES